MRSAQQAVCSVACPQHPYLFHGPATTCSLQTRALRSVCASRPAGAGGRAHARLPDGANTMLAKPARCCPAASGTASIVGSLKAAPAHRRATSALDAENEAAVVDALAIRDHAPATFIGWQASVMPTVLFADDYRVVEDGSDLRVATVVGVSSQFWRQQHEVAERQILAE